MLGSRIAFVALALVALPAAAAETSAEAHIPFANTGGIQDWRALDNKGLYVQGTGRQWYYATLMGPCFGLDTAQGVGFVTSPSDGSFDKFGAVTVGDQRCQVTSLVKSDPPPGEKGKKKP